MKFKGAFAFTGAFAVTAAAVAVLIGQPAVAAEGDTVNAIKARGTLQCGVSTGTNIGKSTLDDKGNWKGFNVDFCHALAAAILGDSEKVRFVPLVWKNAFAALTSSKIDVLARGATYTYQRDAELRFGWPGIYFYDGISFMVTKKSGVKSAKDLDGATICVVPASATLAFVGDYFRSNGMKFTPVLTNRPEQARANMESGRCDAWANELVNLAANRTVIKNPENFTVLAEPLTREPTGPVVLQHDPRFADIVRWSLNALIITEEQGITAANVEKMAKTTNDPELERLLGKTSDFGSKLGLAKDWAVTVIKAVGNYVEMYDRNFGSGSALGLERGLNDLWSRGGLMYSPPYR